MIFSRRNVVAAQYLYYLICLSIYPSHNAGELRIHRHCFFMVQIPEVLVGVPSAALPSVVALPAVVAVPSSAVVPLEAALPAVVAVPLWVAVQMAVVI